MKTRIIITLLSCVVLLFTSAVHGIEFTIVDDTYSMSFITNLDSKNSIGQPKFWRSKVVDSYLFVSELNVDTYESWIEIYDVSDPAAPLYVTKITESDLPISDQHMSTQKVYNNDAGVFILWTDNFGDIQVLNVFENAVDPELKGHIQLDFEPDDIVFLGNYVYLLEKEVGEVDTSNRLVQIDISNPTNPTITNERIFDDVYPWKGVYVKGLFNQYLVICYTNSGDGVLEYLDPDDLSTVISSRLLFNDLMLDQTLMIGDQFFYIHNSPDVDYEDELSRYQLLDTGLSEPSQVYISEEHDFLTLHSFNTYLLLEQYYYDTTEDHDKFYCEILDTDGNLLVTDLITRIDSVRTIPLETAYYHYFGIYNNLKSLPVGVAVTVFEKIGGDAGITSSNSSIPVHSSDSAQAIFAIPVFLLYTSSILIRTKHRRNGS